MTIKAQDILEGICRHRGNRLSIPDGGDQGLVSVIQQKIDEVEWALQAIAELLVDLENGKET